MKVKKVYEEGKNRVWIDYTDEAVLLMFEHDGVVFSLSFDRDQANEFIEDFQASVDVLD